MLFTALAVLLPAAAAYTLACAGAMPQTTITMMRTSKLLMNDPESTRDPEPTVIGSSSDGGRVDSAPFTDYLAKRAGMEASDELDRLRERWAAATQARRPKGEAAYSPKACDKFLSLAAPWNGTQVGVPHFNWAATLTEGTLKLIERPGSVPPALAPTLHTLED